MESFDVNSTLKQLLNMTQQIQEDNIDFDYSWRLVTALHLLLYCKVSDEITADTSVGKIINLDISTLGIQNSRYTRTLKELIALLKQRLAHSIKDVKEPLLHVSSGRMNDLEREECYGDLCQYKCSSASGTVRDYEKVLVISGESGAGKTLSAVKFFPNIVYHSTQERQTKLVENRIVFYACRDSEQSDITSNSERDSLSKKHLADWWNQGWKMLHEKYPAMPASEWRKLLVVLVVDELGNRPQLLRGLISIASEFERSVCTEGANASDVKVGAFKLVCVGTGLDWAVRRIGDLASEAEKYVHIQMLQWTDNEFRTYAIKRLGSCHGLHRVNEVCDRLASLHIARLTSNARCAKFLVDTIQARNILFSLSPSTQLFNMRREIFWGVVNRYKGSNAIGNLFDKRKNEALNILLPALRFAHMTPHKVSSLHEVDVVALEKLLKYGVLSYQELPDNSARLHLSSAMLMMLLSEFGMRDMTVLEGPEFEKLVAMRELCRILMKDPSAKVEIICLQNHQLPPAKANKALLSKKSTEQNSFSFKLPGAYFHQVQRCDCIPKKYDDAYYVMINAPLAHGPDVIVLPSSTSNECVRVIQTEKGKCEYRPTMQQLNDMLGKFGLTNEYPATRAVLTSVIGSKKSEYSFVLSSSGESLISALKNDYQGEEISSGHIKIKMTEHSSYLSECVIAVETINELWKGLLYDADYGSQDNEYVANNHEGAWVFQSMKKGGKK